MLMAADPAAYGQIWQYRASLCVSDLSTGSPAERPSRVGSLHTVAEPDDAARTLFHGVEHETVRCEVIGIDVEQRGRPDAPVRHRRDEQAHFVDQSRT